MGDPAGEAAACDDGERRSPWETERRRERDEAEVERGTLAGDELHRVEPGAGRNGAMSRARLTAPW